MTEYGRKSLFTSQRLAILLLVAHLALGVLYSVVIPIWEAHDEWGHSGDSGTLAVFDESGQRLAGDQIILEE